MSTTAPPLPTVGESSAVAEVLTGTGGPALARRVVLEDAPAVARAALRALISPDAEVTLRPVRSVLRHHRKLTVTFEVTVPGDPLAPRLVAAAWLHRRGGLQHEQATGGLEAEARRRGLAGPFQRLHASDAATGLQLLLAPFDPAFPQLVRWYDPSYVAPLLTALGGHAVARRVTAVRYRPAQRHVLRADGHEPGAGAYLKTYRDETGACAVHHADALRERLRDWAGPAEVPAARYLRRDRVAVWAEVPGQPLGDAVLATPELAALAGRVLRVLHGSGPEPERPRTGMTPGEECATTGRATSHVVTLSAAAASRIPPLLAAAAARLEALPAEPPVALHGDFKCDNVLVRDGVLHLVDLDRATSGDRAVDLAKMSSDLRWFAASNGTDGADLVAAFLDGYGPSPRARRERVACYEAIFLVRAAGRRVPLSDPAWEDRVLRWVDEADGVLRAVPA